MAGGTIEFNFRGNLTQLKRDLAEATRLAKQSAGEVNRSGSSGRGGEHGGGVFDRLFARSGGTQRRAERFFNTALAGGAGGIPNLAGNAVEALGLGVGAGLGVAVAAEQFIKLRERVKEANKAMKELRETTSRPLSEIAQLGSEGIEKELGDNESATNTARKERKNWFIRFGDAVRRAAGRTPEGEGTTGAEAVRQDDSAIVKAMQRRLHLAAAIATAEHRSVDIQEMREQGDERSAKFAEIKAKAEEKIASLRLKYGHDPMMAPSLAQRILNIRRSQRFEESAVNRAEDTEAREDAHAEALGTIQALNVSPRRKSLLLAARRALNAQENLAAARPGTHEWHQAGTEAGLALETFRTGRFQNWQVHNGEGGYNFDLANSERREAREKSAFAQNSKDKADRISRGAYGDSSGVPVGGDTAAGVLKDIKNLLEKAFSDGGDEGSK